MPELHKNQIEWSAPEPKKVSLDKPDYSPLANSLEYLSRVADDTSKTIAGYEDNQLVKSLQDVNTKAENDLETADSLNANYDFIADESIKKWKQTFESANEATKTRFLRNNPYAAEEFEISTRAKAEKKRTEQVYNRSKLDIAQWSSEIINAGYDEPDEKKREEIQNQVLQEKINAIQNLRLPIQMTDDLLFDLRSQLDDYSIATAIANDEFEKADKLIRNGLPTKGASSKALYRQQLQTAMERYEKEKIAEKEAIEKAKEEGKDADSQAVLQIHQALLMRNEIAAADKLRLDYYRGKDIPIYNKKGELERVVHAADTSPVARDKLYGTMLTSANRAPAKDEYRAQYRADFNRLASGLMQKDGSLKLEDDEYVTPEQYVLAKQLKESNEGFNSLERDEQVFIDNILRSYGTSEGLDMLDLNPRTKIRAATLLGNDYQKANPVINYQALLSVYSDPTNIAIALVDPEHQLTGREVDTVAFYADKYISDKFKGDFKMGKGTRSRALATMYTLVATKNNPYSMKELGLQYVSREQLESEMVDYLVQMKNHGYYEQKADYQNLVQDFKNLYKMATGFDYKAEPGKDPLQKYAIIAIQGASLDKSDYSRAWKIYDDKLPKDDALRVLKTQPGFKYMGYTEMNESLRKSEEGYELQKARQRAGELEKEEVTKFKPITAVEKNKKTKNKKGIETPAIKALLGGSSLTE